MRMYMRVHSVRVHPTTSWTKGPSSTVVQTESTLEKNLIPLSPECLLSRSALIAGSSHQSLPPLVWPSQLSEAKDDEDVLLHICCKRWCLLSAFIFWISRGPFKSANGTYVLCVVQETRAITNGFRESAQCACELVALDLIF